MISAVASERAIRRFFLDICLPKGGLLLLNRTPGTPSRRGDRPRRDRRSGIGRRRSSGWGGAEGVGQRSVGCGCVPLLIELPSTSRHARGIYLILVTV